VTQTIAYLPATAALQTPSPLSPRARRALSQAVARLEHAQACGRPWALAEAYRQTAGCYLKLGAWGQAVAMIEHGLRWAHAGGGTDQQLDMACELVEALSLQAAVLDAEQQGSGRATRERARDLVCDASQLARRAADTRWEVTVLLRLSDVLDRFGDRDDATQLQVRALELTLASELSPRALSADDAQPRRLAH